MKNIGEWSLAPAHKTARAVLFSCFFFSGLTGLLYEIVWVRLFTLVFGNTVFSTAAVLAAFMGGLGIGGLVAGRYVEKRGGEVLFYGIAEAVIGLYAFAPPLLIKLLESSYPAIYAATGGGPALTALKAVAAAVILAPATLCMGASFPLLTKFFTARRSQFPGAVSALYGLNTLGAVSGAFLTGFILLAYMGIHDTLLMGMVVNLGIGLLAIIQHGKIGGSREETAAVEEAPAEDGSAAAPARAGGVALILIGIFVSGFVSLLLEVAWTRSLALILGSSTYAFSLILITILLGIALGSFAVGRYFKKRPDSISGTALPGICLMCVAAFATVCFPAMKWAVLYFSQTIGLLKDDYTLVLVLDFIVCVAILLPPMLFFGASFPAFTALYSARTKRISSGVGGAYLWNTLGAILGSALAGFAFIPFAGVHKTLLFGIIAAAVTGMLLLIADRKTPLPLRFGIAAAALAVAVPVSITQKWDAYIMNSGPYMYFRIMPHTNNPEKLTKILKKQAKIVFYHDGAASTVSVQKFSGNTFLTVNGKTDASTTSDAPTQIFVSAMPLLLRPDMRDIAVIGIGSGMTAGAALQFPSVKKLDLLEIEPYVAQAMKFFDDYNFNVRNDPRTHLYLNDARNFFLAHRNKYDLIISEPSNHWIAGVASLYSRDFFNLAASRLRPGGLYSQWVQLYSMSPTSLSMILATFRSVFPETHIFIVGSDMFLIGSKKTVDIDARKIAAQFDKMAKTSRLFLPRYGFDRLGFTISHYVAGPEEVRRLSSIGGINTDERPVLEFIAPSELFASSKEILAMASKTYPIDPVLRTVSEPQTLTADDYFGIASDVIHTMTKDMVSDVYLKKAIELNPRHAGAHMLLADFYSRQGLLLLSNEHFLRALSIAPTRGALVQYSSFLYAQQKYPEVEAILGPIVKTPPPIDRAFISQYAVALDNNGKHSEAARLMISLSRTNPSAFDRANMLLDAAEMFEKEPSPDKKEIFNILLAANGVSPDDPEIARKLALYLLDAGRPVEAENVLTRIFDRNQGITEINLLLSEIKKKNGK